MNYPGNPHKEWTPELDEYLLRMRNSYHYPWKRVAKQLDCKVAVARYRWFVLTHGKPPPSSTCGAGRPKSTEVPGPVRPCMRCQEDFKPTHRFNRMCLACKRFIDREDMGAVTEFMVSVM